MTMVWRACRVPFPSRWAGGGIRPSSSSSKSSFEVVREVSCQDVRQFAALTEDHNPVHFSGEASIVHGALLLGFVSGVMGTQLPGPGSIVLHQNVAFHHPCPVGAKIRIRIDLHDRRKIQECLFTCRDDVDPDLVYISGSAKLKIPKNSSSVDQNT